MRLIFTIFLSFGFIFSNCQVDSNKRILSFLAGNLSINHSNSKDIAPGFSQPTSSETDAFEAMLTYGKIKGNNLFSYGIDVAVLYAKAISYSNYYHSIGIAPTISYEKFIPIASKIYYTPFTDFRIGYIRGSGGSQVQKGILSALNFYPFGLTFCKNKRTFFLFKFGLISLAYNHIKTYDVNNPDQYTTTNTTYGLNALLTQFNFGIQKAF